MQRIISKREKNIFYITIGVIVFSIGFNFFVSPIITKNENLNKEINFTKSKLKKYTQLLGQKEYIESKYSKYFSNFKTPTEPSGKFVLALSELENLAKSSNVRIIDIRPQSPRDLHLYKEIIIDLRTESTMENHLKFIYEIENSLSLLMIKRFQLIAKPNSRYLEGSFSISQLYDSNIE